MLGTARFVVVGSVRSESGGSFDFDEAPARLMETGLFGGAVKVDSAVGTLGRVRELDAAFMAARGVVKGYFPKYRWRTVSVSSTGWPVLLTLL